MRPWSQGCPLPLYPESSRGPSIACDEVDPEEQHSLEQRVASSWIAVLASTWGGVSSSSDQEAPTVRHMDVAPSYHVALCSSLHLGTQAAEATRVGQVHLRWMEGGSSSNRTQGAFLSRLAGSQGHTHFLSLNLRLRQQMARPIQGIR